jgi:hypothetical protein
MSKRLLTVAVALAVTLTMAAPVWALNPQPEPPGKYRDKIKPPNPGYPFKARSEKQRKVAPVKPGATR